MFGTLLAWMQDHQHPIFIISTANDVSALPPELLRKRRFEEVFFVDLPNSVVRKRFFEIHLEWRGRVAIKFDKESLAHRTDGFCRAEIEQVVFTGL